ncbi:MAG: imidazolonepropionase, partial [Chitinophagaceae bacterium]|nr:imidazolonepropionase [Chitinophagaceae bacterium]
MNLLITNIRQLVNVRESPTILRGAELAYLPVIEDAWLLIRDGRIQGYGKMATLANREFQEGEDLYDAQGATILPAWCDSHTHIVFAASREEEFVDKIRGLSYAEIAAKGGGILNSAQKLNDTPEDILFDQAWERLQSLMRLGTGAIEIKSGYGLTVAGELKMLRVIKRLKEKAPIPVKASFLGAHTFPLAYREDHEGYIRMIIDDMLPAIAAEGLADYIDVFCEQGFFNPE